MPRKKIGRQTPTGSRVLPYRKTGEAEATELYDSSGRTARKWQKLLLNDHEMVTEAAAQTMEMLNQAAGLNMKAMRPPTETDSIDGVIGSYDSFDKTA